MRSVLGLFVLVAVVSSVAIPLEFKVAGPLSRAGLFCSVCQDVVNDAENAGASDLKAYLNEKINSMCSSLGFLSSTCEAALKSGVDQLVKDIEAKFTPLKACQDVGMC